jgi:hypothetical protein
MLAVKLAVKCYILFWSRMGLKPRSFLICLRFYWFTFSIYLKLKVVCVRTLTRSKIYFNEEGFPVKEGSLAFHMSIMTYQKGNECVLTFEFEL